MTAPNAQTETIDRDTIRANYYRARELNAAYETMLAALGRCSDLIADDDPVDKFSNSDVWGAVAGVFDHAREEMARIGELRDVPATASNRAVRIVIGMKVRAIPVDDGGSLDGTLIGFDNHFASVRDDRTGEVFPSRWAEVQLLLPDALNDIAVNIGTPNIDAMPARDILPIFLQILRTVETRHERVRGGRFAVNGIWACEASEITCGLADIAEDEADPGYGGKADDDDQDREAA